MILVEAIDRIDNLIKDLFNNNINSYERFLELFPYIKAYYEEFLRLLPELNAIGLDIQPKRLVQDMKDISEAIENKDKVLLFDTFNYRVRETLGWYRQIKEIMEEE